MSNFFSFLPSLPSLTSAAQMTTAYPKHKEEQLIHRPSDLGVPDLSKHLIIFYSMITNTSETMMKKTVMNGYIDLFGNASADEYVLQLSCQQIRGFIKKLMNVLTEKKNNYHQTIGCILGDWVLRLRPKYGTIHHIDIFREIPIAKHLRKIPESEIHFQKVFIALEQECHVIPP